MIKENVSKNLIIISSLDKFWSKKTFMQLKCIVIHMIPIIIISRKEERKKASFGSFGYNAFLKYYPLSERNPVLIT